MKRYRFSDVPNKQKLSHFFTYYSLQAFFAVFAVVVVSYLFYLAVLAPKTDASILWISNTYSLEADASVAAQFEKLDWDNNGDGKSVVMLQHAEFGESFEETDTDSQIALMTILSAGDTDILLVSEAALEWGLLMVVILFQPEIRRSPRSRLPNSSRCAIWSCFSQIQPGRWTEHSTGNRTPERNTHREQCTWR